MAKTEQVDETIQGMIDDIQEQIKEIDNHKVVRAAQQLLAQKAKLQAAQRALMGAGSKTTAGDGGGRVTQAQVVANMDVGTVYTVEALAEKMGTTDVIVRGHLNRGRDERFISVDRGHWALRDPEAGFNSVEDLAVSEDEGEDDE